MKRKILLLTMLLFIALCSQFYAQGVSINSTGTDADTSAMLDISSTTKGFLPPRMTEAQKNAISSPATGLLVYQTDGSSGLYYYNGTSWETFVTGTHYIGESYGGGIVFWVDTTGQHGLISAASDQSTGVRWYAGTNTNTMALGDGIGAGARNTAIIIANQGYGDGDTYAARVCAEYQGGNYGDWYLPSRRELNLMYDQKEIIGGFGGIGISYWSSTEKDSSTARYQVFGNGITFYVSKSNSSSLHVRAIRAF